MLSLCGEERGRSQPSRAVAEALPLPVPDVPLSSPHNENKRQQLPDADEHDTPPAVPTAAYVPGGDTSANTFDSEVDG